MKPMPGPLVVFLITGECDVCLNLAQDLADGWRFGVQRRLPERELAKERLTINH